MAKLWNYEDYPGFLSHESSIVRRWAFDALEKRYPNKYTDEVSRLISDEDSHLACAAPHYLAAHRAVRHAPAILNSFLNDSGNIPSNCALALSKMEYEPALDKILESLSHNISAESLYGIFDYLGSIRNERGREILISAAIRIKDPMLRGTAFLNLLKHNRSQDLELIFDRILRPVKKGKGVEIPLLESVANYWNARNLFNDLSKNMGGKGLIENPEDLFDSFFKRNDHLSVGPDLRGKLTRMIAKRQYHDLVTTLIFEAQNIIAESYPKNGLSEDLRNLFDQDAAGIALFKAFSKQPALWHKIKKFDGSGIGYLVGFLISVFFSIVERQAYVKALLPDAATSDLIKALGKSGSNLPGALCKKIVTIAPVSELKTSLSGELNTWTDIEIVKIMGQIGKPEFVPDLIRVLNEADTMDYIYSDAIDSLRALDESADDLILSAAQNKELGDWELFSILEHLPYTESFDLALERWKDEDGEIDSYELLASCLQGIGDPRGIDVLQDIYNNENDAGYVGTSLECLSLLHNADIPELPAIREKRQERKKQQESRAKELNDIFNDIENKEIPFKREVKKVGRNDPCPCGSGKKYKKCCLNKA